MRGGWPAGATPRRARTHASDGNSKFKVCERGFAGFVSVAPRLATTRKSAEVFAVEFNFALVGDLRCLRKRLGPCRPTVAPDRILGPTYGSRTSSWAATPTSQRTQQSAASCTVLLRSNLYAHGRGRWGLSARVEGRRWCRATPRTPWDHGILPGCGPRWPHPDPKKDVKRCNAKLQLHLLAEGHVIVICNVMIITCNTAGQ